MNTLNPLAQGIHLQKPPHNTPGSRLLIRCRTAAEWPVGTFVENLLPRFNGRVWASIHSSNCIDEVDPTDGSKRTVMTFPAACAGIVESRNMVYVNVGDIGQTNAAVYRVDESGSAERWVEVPEGRFLNGAALLDENLLLVGDAILGKVFLVDLVARTVRTWLEDDLLHKVTAEPYLPGVNGVKVFGGFVYFSNTDRALILRAAVGASGEAGPLETVAERLTADDFAFDRGGEMYICTHVQNTLLRLSPDGSRVDLAGPEAGLAGSTAAAFGRSPESRTQLFVTTTGGILEPYGGAVAPAKLLCLEIGAEGLEVTK